MIDMFAKDQIFIAPDLDINKLMDKGLTDEEIAAEIEESMLIYQKTNSLRLITLPQNF